MLLQKANNALRAGNSSQAIQLYLQALRTMPALEHIITPNLILARKRHRASRQGKKLKVAICFDQGFREDHVPDIVKYYKTFSHVEGIHFNHQDTRHGFSNTEFPNHEVATTDLESFVVDNPYDIVQIFNQDPDSRAFAALSKLIWGAAVLGKDNVGTKCSDARVDDCNNPDILEKTVRETYEKPVIIGQGLLDAITTNDGLKQYAKLASPPAHHCPQNIHHEPNNKPHQTAQEQPIVHNSSNNSSRILFILPGSAESNNGYQVQLLTRMLQAQGAICDIAVPDTGPDQSLLLSKTVSSDVQIKPYSSFLSQPCPDYSVVHAWTPREIVREFTEKILAKHNCPLIIHLEDNEEYLTEATVGTPWAELAKMPQAELDTLIPKSRFHPIRGRKFLDKAQGLTMVIENLNRFNRKNVPYQILPPIVDERLFYPRPINKQLRDSYNISEDTTVLGYTGNVNAGNKDEVFELYKAVDLLNQQGRPTKLLRTGQDSKKLDTSFWPRKHEINLGWVSRQEIPNILAAVDILIQPGNPGPFNDERIPCKLPEYFAMGRPVVLPRTNVGLQVEHGREGYVMDKADATGIAKAVHTICQDSARREKMAENAVDFYLNYSDAFKEISWGGMWQALKRR
jgi:glycosyltransferase involved in cell wall biosynthesis